jgi:uncharacterized protein (TIGR03437 family)
VTNLPDCEWKATANDPYVFITSPSTVRGTGFATYSIAVNDGEARTGTALIAGQPITFNQAAKGGVVPKISTGGVGNAASGLSNGIAPGEFISIYGIGLGATEGRSVALTRSVDGLKVLVNGMEALLTYVSSGQINCLAPYGIENASTADVQVEFQSVLSNLTSIPVVQSSPGIFTLDGSGTGLGVVVNSDSSFNSFANPATKGLPVSFWVTGQGITVPRVTDGVLPPTHDYPKPALPVSISFDGVEVTTTDIQFLGLVYPGVLQVNVVVPSSSLSGVVELLLKVGNNSSRKGVQVIVR